jgi:hypothetical protein
MSGACNMHGGVEVHTEFWLQLKVRNQSKRPMHKWEDNYTKWISMK